MQAWQWFGAALQPWSRGKNQRAWVEWYVVRAVHGVLLWRGRGCALGRWKAAWQICNIRISQVVTGTLLGQPVSGARVRGGKNT